jgi:hypothetical protein
MERASYFPEANIAESPDARMVEEELKKVWQTHEKE